MFKPLTLLDDDIALEDIEAIDSQYPMPDLTSDQIKYILDELDKRNAEEKLLPFIEVMWPILEPGRKLKMGWAIECLAEHLEAVTLGQIPKLLMNVPPGSMKSLTTNVFWPAWEWGPRRLAYLRYISISYTQLLTVRDNRRSKIIIESPPYQKMWGDRFRISDDEASRIKYSNDKTGFKLASSIKGTVMGERGDRLLLDDPNNTKNSESESNLEEVEYFVTEVLPTRINDPETSAIVAIQQRTNSRDFSGLVLSQDLGYEHVCIPMEYEPERKAFTIVKMPWNTEDELINYHRDDEGNTVTEDEFYGFTEESLSEEKERIIKKIKQPNWKLGYPVDPRTEIGELFFPERFPRHYVENDLKKMFRAKGDLYAEASQLQQRPISRGGGLFKREDLIVINEIPENVKVLRWVRAYDLAASEKKKSPFTSGIKMGLGRDANGLYRIIIADVDRFRGEPEVVDARIKQNAKIDGNQVQIDLPQDPGAAGKTAVYYIVKQLHGYDVVYSPESGDKETRARPLAAQSRVKNVYLLQGAWNEEFISEAAVFPRGAYRDQIDSASRAYANLLRNSDTTENVSTPELIHRNSVHVTNGQYVENEEDEMFFGEIVDLL